MNKITKIQMIIVAALIAAIACIACVFLFMSTTVHIDYSDLSGHKEYDIKTRSWTVGSMLDGMDDLTLTDKDEVKPSRKKRIKKGMTIYIVKATEKEAEVSGKKTMLTLYPVSVRENLERNGIKWGDEDIVKPSLDSMTDDYTNIVVINKELKIKEVTKKKKAGTKYVLDSSVASGIVEEEKGKDGEEVFRYTTTYLNGKKDKTKKELVKKKTDPVDGVIKLGTKDTGEIGEVQCKETFDTNVGAYYKGANFKGASGAVCKFGTCAVNPNEIRYGTKLFIEGYGYAIATDTDASLSGKQIAVYMRSETEANSWTVSEKKVYILETP